MASLDVLYLILGVCVVVITVTIVWLANETIQLVRSLKRSAQDTEVVTKEIKEKVMLVGEALDRAGTAATTVIGLIEDAIEQIKEKRDQIVGSIGLLTGAGKYVKQRREGAKKEKPPFAKATEGSTASLKRQVKSVEKKEEVKSEKTGEDKDHDEMEVKEKPKEVEKEAKSEEAVTKPVVEKKEELPILSSQTKLSSTPKVNEAGADPSQISPRFESKRVAKGEPEEVNKS